MAVGVNLIQERQKFILRGTLLENQATATNGQWQDIHSVFPLAVTLEGTFTGVTARLLVSNAPSKPVDTAVNTPQIGLDMTGPDSRTIEEPYRWAKVYLVAIGTGTVNAYVNAG